MLYMLTLSTLQFTANASEYHHKQKILAGNHEAISCGSYSSMARMCLSYIDKPTASLGLQHHVYDFAALLMRETLDMQS